MTTFKCMICGKEKTKTYIVRSLRDTMCKSCIKKYAHELAQGIIPEPKELTV